MANWSELGRFRKILVMILAVSTIVSIVAFALIGGQKGIVHEGCFLQVSTERENTVYAGKMGGEPVSFTVTPQWEVTFRKGKDTVAAYTVTKDPTAVSPNNGFPSPDSGIEVRQGETVVFRGAYYDFGDSFFVNEEGIGQRVPPVVATVIEVACAPQLTKRGDGEMFAYGLLLTALAAVSIFFADALFRFDLAFRIRNADYAEPSEWELFTRTAGQVVFTVLAVICYIVCFVH